MIGWSVDGNCEKLLQLLDQEKMPALVLFPPHALAENDELVRRIVASGHGIGLTVDGLDPETEQQALEQGNGLLQHMARIHTRIAYANGQKGELREQLEAMGWIFWEEDVVGGRASGEDAVENVMHLLRSQSEGTVRILLEDSGITTGGLAKVLQTLQAERYQLQAVTETVH